jgi:predicted DNA-binding WGR domain protein
VAELEPLVLMRSAKRWSAAIVGTTLVISFGRATRLHMGRSVHKGFASVAAALAAAEKAIRAKLADGYVVVKRG